MLGRASRGSHGLDRFRHRFEAGRVRGDELAILQAVAQDHVQHAEQQRDIGARPHRKKQIGVAGDRRHPRIDDDQLSAVVAAAPEVVGGDRRAFGRCSSPRS